MQVKNFAYMAIKINVQVLENSAKSSTVQVTTLFYVSASQFLPIPELIPFRLTRQLRNLMMPLQVHGLMESTMIHTLRALRNNCDLLLNTMDIFVKEPSVDWLVSAPIFQAEQNFTDDNFVALN